MIRALSRLFRLRLALLNGVAAVGGCLLSPDGVNRMTLWSAFCGVALLAAGGSALNQVLERDLDRLMLRTRQRPLPQRQLTAAAATAIGTVPVLAGLVLLAAAGGLVPTLLGGAALVWYLAVYTPLKLRTACAPAVGAVCGALPPVIGWSLTGGSPVDYRVMMLAGVMYLWQIPHFWLFQRRYADDYRRAGIPLMEGSSRGPGLFGLWLAALIAAAMLLPAFGIVGSRAALWYALFPLPLIALTLLRSEVALFSYLNLFPLLVTLALCVRW